jgi:ACS family hexuronate transporter-like MFS transporter
MRGRHDAGLADNLFLDRLAYDLDPKRPRQTRARRIAAHEPMTVSSSPRSSFWKWLVCGLLLLASMLLYMDRQTLPNVATRITREFHLNQQQYGDVEAAFGYAFAVGAFFWGFLADRWSVRWLYPMVLFCWSIVGFLTGLVEDYGGLLLCRTLLGFFESGHWPCALKTTQRLLAREQRTLGNSVLQSGASFGAILTPLLMNLMVAGRADAGAWRKPFLVIGSLGAVWLVAWFSLLRARDFTAMPDAMVEAGASARGAGGEGSFWRILLDRRFLVLVVIVSCINICWQILRAWLPKFLQEGRGYLESESLYFNSLYYLATDAGCLAAGVMSVWLVRHGLTVHASRVWVFGLCAVLTSLTMAVAFLPRGWVLLTVLLVVGAGALGLFPCYYSFTQELSTRHQGKVTGLLATAAWATSSPLQSFFGWLVDTTQSFDVGIAVAGLTPMIGLLALLFFWREPKTFAAV